MLKVKFNGTDLTRQQSKFNYLDSTVAFDGSNYLEIGFTKPISNIFFNLTESGLTRTVAVEYYNGTEFTRVKNALDLTFGYTKSGFISWDKNQANEAKQTGEDLYWYRFTLATASSVVFKGIGPLFSEDSDLIGEYPTILDHLPEGRTSFAKFHESARKAIVTDLRKSGISVQGINEAKRKQLDAYDLLDIEEVRECSKFLTLSKIFGWLSDSTGDKWENLKDNYAAQAAGAITPLISIDKDNDGLQDDEEVGDTSVVLVGRL
jgi:hypothetical protein